MKLALLLNVIDPKIGGVMIMGDRGTGKSTTIRALADLLPEIDIVADDPFSSHPDDPEMMGDEARQRLEQGMELAIAKKKVQMVDLPLGATEDRVCGTIDIEKALSEGIKAFEPGLLAKANRGILYVDEVNLLDDHLVDVLLDSAASGWNTVEREGISIRHPARFVLVGSGNPEEGELRPQLLDRFGLSVEVRTPPDIAERVEIVRRADAYARDRSGFAARWAKADAALGQRLTKARARLARVATPDAALEAGARLCIAVGVDGLRGELTLLRAARALAALEGLRATTPALVARAAPMALGHRLRRDPLDEAGSRARIARAVTDLGL